MRKTTVLLILATMFCSMAFAQSRTERLRNIVNYLADDSLRGRKAGSNDAFKAAEYLKNEYQKIGLKPLLDDYYLTFFLPFEESFNDVQLADSLSLKKYRDIVCVIPGTDPLLKDEYIVLAAHYDHLGVTKNGDVYNGADDNASGSAALVEIARELASKPLKRSVIIAAVDAEEMGLFGSKALVKKLSDLDILNRVRLMMSIDMVGWLKQNETLIMEGYGTIKHGDDLLLNTAKETQISVKLKKFETSELTATDTEPFAKKGLATLAVTTGLKSPYHKPTDDAVLIDFEGMSKVVDYITNLTLKVANDEAYKPSGRVAKKHGGYAFPVEFGGFVGVNTSALNFRNTKYRTHTRHGLDAGLSLQYNITKHLAVRISGEYNRENDYYLNPANSHLQPLYVAQNQISVPLSLVWKGENFYFLAGPTYSYCFGESNYDKLDLLPYSKSLWGFNLGFGIRAGHFYIEDVWSPQYDVFQSSDNANPSVNRSRFGFRMGWWF